MSSDLLDRCRKPVKQALEDAKLSNTKINDAEIHAQEGRKRRQQIDTKNLADSLIYQSEKQLQDLGDKVSGTNRSRIEALINDLRQAINQDNRSH